MGIIFKKVNSQNFTQLLYAEKATYKVWKSVGWATWAILSEKNFCHADADSRKIHGIY
jgi:hypothetical protein